MQEYEHTLLDY